VGSNAGDNGNQRVTIAVLGQKIDAVRDDLREYARRQEEHDRRLRAVEQEQARVRERIGLVAGVQAFVSLILSALAAWLGVQK